MASRSISRDPEMFPDPEAFNPLRWIEPEYPTYQEPLTQFPTIINSTQFGYGRRTCQGQAVTDEDLLIGIGSIAWLFDISRKPEDTSIPDATESKKEHKIGMNEKASISNEELNAGVDTSKDATMEAKILSKYSYPGTVPANKSEPKPAKPSEPAYKPMEWGDITKKPEDPTLDFSILLIAKPIPFKFNLQPRDPKRVNMIRDLFNEGVNRGDYVDSRAYWGPNQGRDKPLGWSKV
jgi:hypothetical protein